MNKIHFKKKIASFYDSTWINRSITQFKKAVIIIIKNNLVYNFEQMANEKGIIRMHKLQCFTFHFTIHFFFTCTNSFTNAKLVVSQMRNDSKAFSWMEKRHVITIHTVGSVWVANGMKHPQTNEKGKTPKKAVKWKFRFPRIRHPKIYNSKLIFTNYNLCEKMKMGKKRRK